ncbi:hypothetical protein HAX54_042884 [Datura stramonium]|uniref:Uncharacterized protein n=1 Tax=Datura stramonium TaxID=4076 RepID=A0ABS8W050_DATST|nr:hypothetical protein [Datura stramonium]
MGGKWVGCAEFGQTLISVSAETIINCSLFPNFEKKESSKRDVKMGLCVAPYLQCPCLEDFRLVIVLHANEKVVIVWTPAEGNEKR